MVLVTNFAILMVTFSILTDILFFIAILLDEVNTNVRNMILQ